MELNSEQIASLVSIATVSLLHTLLPSHWLCFSLVGRAQGWPLRRTLSMTALAGTLHVLSTIALGILFVRLERSILPHESHEVVSALLLMGMGTLYLLLHLLGKGHRHEHDMNRAATGLLLLLPTLSPCTAVIPFIMFVAGKGIFLLVLVAAVLLVSTLGVMLLLVTLSSLGVEKIRFEFVNRYEKALIGGILCLLGALIFALHRHHGA